MKKSVGYAWLSALLFGATTALAEAPTSQIELPLAAPTTESFDMEKKNDAENAEKKEKKERNLGHVSGSFETNTIYYVKDERTGATVPKNNYGSNNYLKVDYQRNKLSAGVQIEYYPQPLVGTPAEMYEYVLQGAGWMTPEERADYCQTFDWGNLAGKYIAWTDRNFSVTVGDFYEQFGSGLILRSWEDRTLGFNNSLGGARVTFNIKDIVTGKALYALPRFYMDYLSTQIAGGDLSVSLSNAIGLQEHVLNLEGSVVNTHRTNLPGWYYDVKDYVSFEEPSLNVLSYSARIGYEYRGLSAKFEYVGKSKDLYNNPGVGDYVYEPGNAQLAEVAYTGDGFSVSAQFRRLKNMQSRLYQGEDDAETSLANLAGNVINYVPALSTQHTYMLSSLDPNYANLDGEMGGQIDAYYLFKRGTALGGKRGMKIHASYALYYSLDGATDTPGNQFRYRDFSFDIDKTWNKKLRTILYVSLQKNALHAVGHYVRQNIFVADVTYKFTRAFSLRAELQYNYAPGTGDVPTVGGDWVGGLLEANFAPKWSIFFSDMYNHGNPNEKINYYSAGASFTHKFIRVALSYGRNRAGMICSGGVCRYMPAYTGGNLQMTLTF